MLGEQIGHETGQITGMRVLPGEDGGARLNGLVGVFEYETHADGTSEDSTHEWK
jgi:hypothetical protein